MNDTETVYVRSAWIFFDHDIHGASPTFQGDAFVDGDMKKFGKGAEKSRVRGQCLVVAKMLARRRGSGFFTPLFEAAGDICSVNGG